MRKRIHAIAIKLFFALCCVQFICISVAIASSTLVPDGIKLSYGAGEPDNLQGGMLGLQWYWGKRWFKDYAWGLGGYWDFNVAHWYSDGDVNGKNKDLTAIAFAPVFRL